MTVSTQSLMNMEMMLYGGKSYSQYVPSMYNNYLGRTYDNTTQNNTAGNTADSSIFSNYSYPHGYTQNYNQGYTQNYSTNFRQSIPSIYQTQQLSQNQAQSSTASSNVFSGLSEKEQKALTDCYVKTPSESLLSAAWGGVTFGLMNNPRFIAHPINTFKAFKGLDTDTLFKSVTQEGSALNKLWTNPETNSVLRDAYCEMHRVFARGEDKRGWFRKAYSKETVNELKGIMEKALKEAKTKTPEEAKRIIAEATAKLESAYVTDGPLKWLAKPFLGFSGGSKAKTVTEGLANTEFISSNVTKALENTGSKTFKNAIKSHAGIGGIILFAAFEFMAGWSNIQKAFAKDKENKEKGIKTNYGLKQLGQTTVKGLGSGLGWGLGEGVGTWAFAKWGMKLGSKFHPVIGTIIGGIAGLVGGSIGMMLMGRITKAAVGEDIGEKLSAQELTQTTEGQIELLQTVAQKVQKGEASPEAQAALQKLYTQIQAQQAAA